MDEVPEEEIRDESERKEDNLIEQGEKEDADEVDEVEDEEEERKERKVRGKYRSGATVVLL